MIVTPKGGTALVFGGNITHAGQPVTSGERLVLVASFSQRPDTQLDGVQDASNWRRTLGGRHVLVRWLSDIILGTTAEG